MSAFEQAAIARVVDKARALGVDVPDEVAQIACGFGTSTAGGRAWVDANPGQDIWCCIGALHNGPDACTCWVPEYDVEQLPPRLGVPEVRERMCGDCAFRPGSPERAEEYSEETLLELALTGTPFWCHDGMRRPSRWRHPELGVVDGRTDDWQPAMLGPLPFRADGRPALLCAGWAAHGRAAMARDEVTS